MRYLDVCAGISAATIAWTPLGWRAAAYSEIDPDARRVLAHHYPEVPLHGDFTMIQEQDFGSVDVLVGGTPCQDFSLAGLRAGLGGERGNLTLEYGRLARRKRTRWFVWENVPGVFSNNEGRDFGAVLASLAGYPDGTIFRPPADGWRNAGIVPPANPDSHGLAWRVLDAQFAGVPQRRRRVFIVGYIGDWRPSLAVLLERASLQGHPPPRAETGQGPSATVTSGAPNGGRAHGARSGSAKEGLIVPDVSPTLRAGGNSTGGDRPPGTDVDTADSLIVHAVTSKWAKGSGGPAGDECQNLVAFPQNLSATQRLSAEDVSPALGAKNPVAVAGAIAAQSFTGGAGGRPDGAAAGHFVPVAFTSKDHGQDAGELSPTLRAGHATDSNANGGVMPAVAQAMGVRRFTPRECERLQGFPDDFTKIPVRHYQRKRVTRTRPEDYWVQDSAGGWFLCLADGPRYKLLGNSMAVPVMRWLGERIALVDSILVESVAA